VLALAAPPLRPSLLYGLHRWLSLCRLLLLLLSLDLELGEDELLLFSFAEAFILKILHFFFLIILILGLSLHLEEAIVVLGLFRADDGHRDVLLLFVIVVATTLGRRPHLEVVVGSSVKDAFPSLSRPTGLGNRVLFLLQISIFNHLERVVPRWAPWLFLGGGLVLLLLQELPPLQGCQGHLLDRLVFQELRVQQLLLVVRRPCFLFGFELLRAGHVRNSLGESGRPLLLQIYRRDRPARGLCGSGVRVFLQVCLVFFLPLGAVSVLARLIIVEAGLGKGLSWLNKIVGLVLGHHVGTLASLLKAIDHRRLLLLVAFALPLRAQSRDAIILGDELVSIVVSLLCSEELAFLRVLLQNGVHFVALLVFLAGLHVGEAWVEVGSLLLRMGYFQSLRGARVALEIEVRLELVGCFVELDIAKSSYSVGVLRSLVHLLLLSLRV